MHFELGAKKKARKEEACTCVFGRHSWQRSRVAHVYPVVWGYLKEDTVSTLQTVVKWAI